MSQFIVQTMCQIDFFGKKYALLRHFGTNYFVISRKSIIFALRIL
jgi:hypothetical protein